MKKILFLTGTRADYGKMKSLIQAVESSNDFEAYVYITGMHMLNRYGYTANEVMKDGFKNTYMNINQHVGDHMEIALANTVSGLSHYVHELKPDMLVIHGDRLEALAGSIVGAFTNTLVAHIEGGELSGTIDDSIRHSISKLAHLHFVCNKEAKAILTRMGEHEESIYEIGSPDYDLMFSDNLPSLNSVKEHYNIPFDDFGIVLFHPVTTDAHNFKEYTDNLVSALNASSKNYIVVYPNNDEGNDSILEAYKNLSENCLLFPSLSFERFIVLLKYSQMLLGNSSAGIREAPCYGVPTINIGDRQNKRFKHDTIFDTSYDYKEILEAIELNWNKDLSTLKIEAFGDGNSASKFMEALKSKKLWATSIQKVVFDD